MIFCRDVLCRASVGAPDRVAQDHVVGGLAGVLSYLERLAHVQGTASKGFGAPRRTARSAILERIAGGSRSGGWWTGDTKHVEVEWPVAMVLARKAS